MWTKKLVESSLQEKEEGRLKWEKLALVIIDSKMYTFLDKTIQTARGKSSLQNFAIPNSSTSRAETSLSKTMTESHTIAMASENSRTK